MNNNTQQENLDSRVRAVWRRGQMLHISAGMLAFFQWGILLFLAGMTIDWMTYMPTEGRVVIFVVLLGVSTYKAWRAGWRHTRVFNAMHTALQIEKHHGGLESLLVTAIQFQDPKLATAGTSEVLREMTCRQAEEAIRDVRSEKIIRYGELHRPLKPTLALALVIGILAVVNGPFLGVGLARIFPPWMGVNYPTQTQLDVESGDMTIKEGSPTLIQARVLGVIPSGAKLALRTGTGKPRIHALTITNGVCEYSIKATFRGFEYRILAGDARSVWHSVDVVSSPRIKHAQVSLEFPSYTNRSTETVEALTVTVPEATRIKWQLTLDRAVSKAYYTPIGGEAQPLDISSDGYSITMKGTATESRAYHFSW